MSWKGRGSVMENRGRREFERKRRGQRKKKLLHRMLLTAFLLINFFLLLYLLGRLKELDQEMRRINAVLTVQMSEAFGYREASGYSEAKGNIFNEGDYVSQCGLDSVEPPRARTKDEIMDRLAGLGEVNDVIQDIYLHSSLYPDKMLEALANNPEMADFVSGYGKADLSVSGGLTESEKSQEYPLFLQWDPRWGYESYGDGSIVGLAGCGPTCLSMVLYYLTGNEELTPDEIAAYGMRNGYYVSGTGTAWALLEDTPPLYGVGVEKIETDEKVMQMQLDQGHPLIVSVGAGDFTVNGHFIVVYGYDKNGFLVNDPNCVARSRQSWTYDRLERQIKCIWAFS